MITTIAMCQNVVHKVIRTMYIEKVTHCHLMIFLLKT